MATAIPQPASFSRRKIHSLKVDMTPMVDLGFLLITFFIFTAALSQPAVLKLIMPKETGLTPVRQSEALTILLDKDKAYSYEGLLQEAISQNRIRKTDYSMQTGMGSIIRKKQTLLKGKGDLVVLIKPLPQATYQSIIAALDEMQINGVKKYAVLDATAEEKTFVQNHVW